MKVVNPIHRGFALLLTFFLVGFTLAAPKVNHGFNSALDPFTPSFPLAFANHDDKWGGVVFKRSSAGHFTAVQGSFIVPKVSVPAGAQGDADWEATVQVGFGGTVDDNNYWLQVGVLLSVQPSGTTTYRAFHVWYPESDPVFDDAELSISEGDELTLRVESYSSTDGAAIVENHTTGKGVHKILIAPTGARALLGQHAEWFISEPINNRLANFGVVTFTEAVAYTIDGNNVGPDSGGALIATIRDDGRPMTETVTGPRELRVTYKPQYNIKRASDPRDPNRPGGAAGVRFSELPSGGYNSIEATFAVPAPTLPPVGPIEVATYTAVISMGIGGPADDNVPLFVAGIKLTISSQTGYPTGYEPFFKADGSDPVVLDFQTIAAGDIVNIRFSFGADMIWHLTFNDTTTNTNSDVSAPDPRHNFPATWAEFSVQDPPYGETNAPFPNFGVVNFTTAVVGTTDGQTFGPGEAPEGVMATGLISSPQGVPMTGVVVGPRCLSIAYKPLG